MALLTQLESFSFNPYPCTRHFNEPLEFMVQALRHLTSPHLQELTITFLSATYRLLNCDTWSELDLILKNSRFSLTLRALTFRFFLPCMPLSPEAAAAREEQIAARLPLCAARGILRIQSVGRREV
jgi:hypothetical protein